MCRLQTQSVSCPYIKCHRFRKTSILCPWHKGSRGVAAKHQSFMKLQVLSSIPSSQKEGKKGDWKRRWGRVEEATVSNLWGKKQRFQFCSLWRRAQHQFLRPTWLACFWQLDPNGICHSPSLSSQPHLRPLIQTMWHCKIGAGGKNHFVKLETHDKLLWHLLWETDLYQFNNHVMSGSWVI